MIDVSEKFLAHTALDVVATYGRSGSSRLMEILKLTGAAAVAGRFPFEVRTTQFAIICASGAGLMNADGSVALAGIVYQPPVPRHGDESESAFCDRVLANREHLRPYRGLLGIGPIAEKAIGLQVVEITLRHCKLAHCVLIDRDPRDIFLSVLDFNKKRGFISFGAEAGELVLARRIAEYIVASARLFAFYPDRTRIVSYTDLVENPERAASAATARPISFDRVEPGHAHPDHLTAASPERSLGRWFAVRELWKEEFAILENAHAEFHEITRSS